MRCYFFESNIPLDKTVYLPLVSGMLQAYCQTFPELGSYEFMPFIFMRDTPDNLMKKFDNPDVVAFSVCIWNHQLSLEIARRVKEKYPKCVIIFGGPQPEKDDTKKYPFIDYIVTEEGEKKFAKLLGKLIGVEINNDHHGLDDFPSPYTKGLYDQILKENPDINFQAIVETNRGCPFTCSFCYWGQGFAEKKVRHHTLDYAKEEARWIARNGIRYVFMADANFGMYERDYEIAKIYSEVKKEYNYPDKVRVCYGKNKEENVFKTALLFSKAGLAKGITLARQSNSEPVLNNIRRSNIKLGVYSNLQERYHKEGIPTYTEIILGLPGETVETFKRGVEETVGSPTQLFIYHCSVLPNTEMSGKNYIAKHGIRTVRVPLAEIHCEIRNPENIVEYEDLIIGTNTMTTEEWMECAVYSWVVQLKHSFGVDCDKEELKRFREIAQEVVNGHSRGQVDLRFGNYYFEPEELSYLHIALERGEIEGDLKEFAKYNVLWGRKSRVKRIEIKVGD